MDYSRIKKVMSNYEQTTISAETLAYSVISIMTDCKRTLESSKMWLSEYRKCVINSHSNNWKRKHGYPTKRKLNKRYES